MKKKLLTFLLLFIANLAITQKQFLPPSIEYHIQDEITVQELPPLQWILEEGKQALDHESLQAGNIKDALVIDLQESEVFQMKAKHPYWIKLKFSSDRTQKGNFLRLIQNGDISPLAPTLRRVDAYWFKSENLYSKGLSGFIIPTSQRDVPQIFSHSIIQLKINQSETVEVWLRIISENKIPAVIQSELISFSNVDALNTSKEYTFMEALFLGALLALFIIGSFLFLWFKEVVYFWFLLLLLMVSGKRIIYHVQDQLVSNFFPEYPGLRGPIVLFFVSGFVMCLLQFGRVYIDTKNSFPKIDRFLKGFLWFLLIISIYFIITHYYSAPVPAFSLITSVIDLIGFLGVSGLIGMLIYLFFSGNKLARFYSFGAIFFWISILINNVIAILDLVVMIDVSALFNIGLMTTMILALAYRFRLMNDMKEKAQAEKTDQLQAINTASAKFVPSTFLNFLGKKNILDATLGDFVEKQVSVLFSDIRDFTTLSEQMTPEENFRFVNIFNQRMGPIIQKHQGFVNQYLGDGIMAIFPEKTEATLQAAIEMQQSLQIYNKGRIFKNRIPLRMGIGIHAGDLIMGIIGDENRMDAATISDTVNAASRVEGLTKYFGVNILLSEDGFAKMEDNVDFNFRYLGKVLVKGKNQPIGIYECFDGDSPAQLKLKKQTLPIFEKGLQQYFDQSFTDAAVAFKSVLEKNPEDAPAKLFLEKAALLISGEVGENWTGVEKMKKK